MVADVDGQAVSFVLGCSAPHIVGICSLTLTFGVLRS
jgi:hypothetical protein